MNFGAIVEKIKSDRILQIIIIFSLFFVFLFLLRPIFFPKKKPKIPCYNLTLKIWAPFSENDLYPLISPFTKYCVSFKIEEKSLAEIKENLLLSLASNSFPDIVYLDDDYLNKYPQFFATPTPINIDTLVAYYNKDVLNFLQLKKPRTLEELKEFIQKIRDYKKENFYPVGLGSLEVKNRHEIILTLLSLDENYQEKEKLKENLLSALEIYTSFSNPQNEFFSYPPQAGNDELNFAQEKLALYLGFYKDKKEILNLNPRLNYEIDFLPLNTFPPKTKIYSQIYYFVPVKKRNSKAAEHFLKWFYQYQLKKLAEIYDLVPFVKDEELPQEKKIVVETVKNQGETFNFFNKEIILGKLDKILENWQDENEVRHLIEQIYFSL